MKKVGKAIGFLFPKLKLTNQSYTSTTKRDAAKLFVKNSLFYNDKHVAGSVRAALVAMGEV